MTNGRSAFLPVFVSACEEKKKIYYYKLLTHTEDIDTQTAVLAYSAYQLALSSVHRLNQHLTLALGRASTARVIFYFFYFYVAWIGALKWNLTLLSPWTVPCVLHWWQDV